MLDDTIPLMCIFEGIDKKEHVVSGEIMLARTQRSSHISFKWLYCDSQNTLIFKGCLLMLNLFAGLYY